MTTATATPASHLDSAAVDAAQGIVDAAIRDFLAPARGPRAVVVAAPAGAGKTQLVTAAVGRARGGGLRVAVATPTNEQAFALVRRIAGAGQPVSFLPASTVALPEAVRALPGVRELERSADANGEALVVGTLSKLGDAFTRDLAPFDALVVDEAYQADSARYFAVGGLAPRHLLVGDSGQINPFSTIADPQRWRGLPEDPLQTAVGVLLRNHRATTPLHRLPI